MKIFQERSVVVGFAGICLSVAFFVLWYGSRDLSGWAIVIGVSAILLLLSSLVLHRDEWLGFIRLKSTGYQATSIALVFAMAVLVVGVYGFAQRYDRTWDMTNSRSFTLASQTQMVLSQLDEPIDVYGFFRSNSGMQTDAKQLLSLFENESSNFQVKWIDPLTSPLEAKQFEVVSENGTVLMTRQDGRTERVEGLINETRLLDGLILLMSDQVHRLCFSTGHGEVDLGEGMGAEGIGLLVEQLESQNFEITQLNLATEPLVSECSVFIVMRPTVEWLPFELESMAAYIASGGRVLALLDPGLVPHLSGEFQRYGLRVGEDIVLDSDPSARLMGIDDPSLLLVLPDRLRAHPITEHLRAALILGIARSVNPIPDREGIVSGVGFETSDQGWAEQSLETMPAQPDPGVDPMGSIPLMGISEIMDPEVIGVVLKSDDEAMLGEAYGGLNRGIPEDFAPKSGGRVVVIGDSDFATNALVSLGNNQDLFLNTITWLVGADKPLGERPSEGEALEISGVGSGVICVVSVVLIPGLAFILAMATIFRRRAL